MKVQEKIKSELNEKFQKVLAAPESFDFFVAIHDFVKYIENNASLSHNLRDTKKSNRDPKIPIKYSSIKQIYQGLEDSENTSNADLGHARYMALLDLNRIRNNEFSDSNTFWRKRELFRKLTGEIYERLNPSSV